MCNKEGLDAVHTSFEGTPLYHHNGKPIYVSNNGLGLPACRETLDGRKFYVCGAREEVSDLLDKMGTSEKLAMHPSQPTEIALQAALDDLGIESDASECKFG